MKNFLLGAALAALLAAPAAAAEERPIVEVALLLDTSNSMDGLIDQARARLWTIVNTMALSRKGGVTPDLRVALYEYGNDGLSPETGYIREVVPLSTDLDRISAELFALKTNGGSEFCGQAIRTAVDRLQWSRGDGYRAIFIAGNEPFTQGPVSPGDAVTAAICKGVIVNRIHCGPEAQAHEGQWDVALMGGQLIHIDQNTATAAVAAPQDQRLAELSAKLNLTYLGYGRNAAERKELQEKQDENAAGAAPGASAQRAISKANAAYRNSMWDLVDALDEKTIDLATVKDEDLPEEMRKMTLEERKAYVAKKAEERRAIQEEVKKLSAERDAFIAAERKKMAESQSETFESAVQETVAAQMKRSGFEVEIKR